MPRNYRVHHGRCVRLLSHIRSVRLLLQVRSVRLLSTSTSARELRSPAKSRSSSSCPGVPTGRCYGWTGYPALSYMLYPAGYSRLPVSALEVNRVGEKPFTVILKYTFIILILRQKCFFLVKSFFQPDIRPKNWLGVRPIQYRVQP